MSVDPALQTALGQSVVTMFCAMRINLPARPLLLLDGAAEVRFDSGFGYGTELYRGIDSEFGTIASLEQISGGDGDEAPELQMSLYPADGVAAATLSSSNMQGSEVLIFIGALNPMTGLVVGQPYLQFMGEVDVPTLNSSQEERTVEFTIVSVFDRLFAIDEGVRATDGFHQSVWPGERGLEYMTGTAATLYWGGKPPPGYEYGSTAALKGSAFTGLGSLAYSIATGR
ncbi:MAG TPA: hypothetical protein VF503_01365 [Sphingobium sp.]|uniref:hypothetical protein n=1 Tax=Sphingobium sp. TaxID=1912891 RepID=UPI002ED1118B